MQQQPNYNQQQPQRGYNQQPAPYSQQPKRGSNYNQQQPQRGYNNEPAVYGQGSYDAFSLPPYANPGYINGWSKYAPLIIYDQYSEAPYLQYYNNYNNYQGDSSYGGSYGQPAGGNYQRPSPPSNYKTAGRRQQYQGGNQY